MAGEKAYVSYMVLIPVLVLMFGAAVVGLWVISEKTVALAENTVTVREYDRWTEEADKRDARREARAIRREIKNDKRAERVDATVQEILLFIKGLR